MTSSHVRERLSLWVGGDLDPAAAAEVAEHLRDCPDCRTAAAELEAGLAWLREDAVPPFTAAERLELRAAVMSRLRHRSGRRLAPRLLLAAAALAALLLTRDAPRPAAPAVESAAAPTVAALPLPAATPAAPPRLVRRTSSPAVPPSVLARIELQTEDPNIRIIWLAPQGDAPDRAINPS